MLHSGSGAIEKHSRLNHDLEARALGLAQGDAGLTEMEGIQNSPSDSLPMAASVDALKPVQLGGHRTNVDVGAISPATLESNPSPEGMRGLREGTESAREDCSPKEDRLISADAS